MKNNNPDEERTPLPEGPLPKGPPEAGSRGGVWLTVVNKGGGPQPQLCAAFARGVHDAEVVDAGPEDSAVGRAKLGDASQEDLHTLPHEPAEQSPGSGGGGGGGRETKCTKKRKNTGD